MGMTINSIATQKMATKNIQQSSEQLASGKRINSAKDDASGLAQAELLTSQINALEQGMNNTADMSNLIGVAEGASSVITDSLSRVEELTLQAQNGTLSADDVNIIQNEVNQIMEGINQIAQNTEFNGKPLLDGSTSTLNTASSSNGMGQQVSMPNLTIENLNISNFDVRSADSIEKIQQAKSTVVTERANMGSASNRLEYTMNSNSITSINLASAKSRIVDADMAKVASNKEKSELIQEYSINMQKKQMEEERNKPKSLFI
jgi:flagellin